MKRTPVVGLIAILSLATVALFVPAAAAAERFEGCSVMIGMSQVRNAFHGAYNGLTAADKASFNQHWFLHWYPGQVLGGWADPNNLGWTSPRFDLGTTRVALTSTCQSPTHASFGFDPQSGARSFDEALDAVVANAKAEYPTLGTMDVWLLVGDENHARCDLAGRWVRAADLHNSYYSMWQGYAPSPRVIAGVTVTLGPDLHVACPTGWRDSKGHLSTTGQAVAGASWLAFQEAS